MMLAKAENIDVSDNDHLVVVLGKDGVVDDVDEPVLVALGHPHERLGVPLGRAQQALAVRVLADALQHGAQRLREHEQVGFGLGGGKVEALLGGLGCGGSIYGREDGYVKQGQGRA